MNVNTRHAPSYSTHCTLLGLIAVFISAQVGCWEKIHYTPPSGQAAKSAATTSAATANRDVSAASEPAPATASEAATEPAADFAADVAAALDDKPVTSSEDAIVKPTDTAAAPAAAASETAARESVAVAAAPAVDPRRSPRRMSWLLGSNLSLAALANARAADPARVADWEDKSQRLAKLLGVALDDLPPRPAADAVDPQANAAIEYLFNEGQTISRYLAAHFGDDHVAVFELALKSNILLVRYQPGAPIVQALAAAISQAGERAKIPAELYEPLLKLLDASVPAKDVRDAVFELHARVDHYLSTGQP